MGMTCTLLRVTKNELNEYLNDSSLLEDRIHDNDESEDENENLIDIDKSWDGIIFLLTRQKFGNGNHPLLQVLFSEQFSYNSRTCKFRSERRPCLYSLSGEFAVQ